MHLRFLHLLQLIFISYLKKLTYVKFRYQKVLDSVKYRQEIGFFFFSSTASKPAVSNFPSQSLPGSHEVLTIPATVGQSHFQVQIKLSNSKLLLVSEQNDPLVSMIEQREKGEWSVLHPPYLLPFPFLLQSQ